MKPKPGMEVHCPCGEWVKVKKGVNGRPVAERGHCWHFFVASHHDNYKRIYGEARRSHYLTENDRLRVSG